MDNRHEESLLEVMRALPPVEPTDTQLLIAEIKQVRNALNDIHSVLWTANEISLESLERQREDLSRTLPRKRGFTGSRPPR
jgi:hypothetical protein